MIKFCLPLLTVCLSINTIAQNVGIGTTTPSARLEIKNPVKSVVKISSNNYSDTSQLNFSNRNAASEGTDMLITSNRETGLRFSSSSDLAINTKDTILQIVPTGRVGIRTATPQYPLDVNGDINVNGEIKANGSSGENGQFLRSNGNGTMSWASKDRFRNFKVFRNTGSTSSVVTSSFTFPAGVTEVAVEIWGGGGEGSDIGGAGSGAYLYAVFPVGSFTSLTTNVGAGGGCIACSNTIGYSSTVTLPAGALTLTAAGGYTATFIEVATFNATGTYLANVSYFGIQGESPKGTETYYENSPAGYYIFLRNSSGGDAPLRPGTGGRSGWRRTNWDGSNAINGIGYKGSEPGGGGGFPTGAGGSGQIIVYW